MIPTDFHIFPRGWYTTNQIKNVGWWSRLFSLWSAACCFPRDDVQATAPVWRGRPFGHRSTGAWRWWFFFLQETLKLGLETMGSMGFGMFRDVSPGFSKARLRFLLPNSSQLHGLVPAPASDITSGTLATCLAVASSGWNPVKFRTFSSEIPSGYVNIAIKNGHRNSGFSHETWWFSIVMGQFTRGYQESSGDHDVSQRIFDHLEVQRCLNHGSCTGKQHSLYIWFIWWLNSDAVRLPSADISMYLFSSSI